MDIIIPDVWLREFLKTRATPKQIQEYLSLCGPSVERILGTGKGTTYAIEVTTNRTDSASVYGIAREAAAILPRFDIKAILEGIPTTARIVFKNSVSYIKANVDSNLCPRFTAILIRDVEIKESPAWLKERLELVNSRPINNVVDISNYLMYELGQPVHTFDYDKIKAHKMVLRASKKGEKIKTLDGQSYTLPGGDIVIEDGEKRLIDLAGIMGGANSAVDSNTKNILLFVQIYNSTHIRQTSMSLPKRTDAASLFEKGLDPEQVAVTLTRGVDLLTELTGGKSEPQALDIYPKPYKKSSLRVDKKYIEDKLGIALTNEQITKTLVPLGFSVKWEKDRLNVSIPSFRAKDISIPEDIVEEIARIYGYHNLPSELMPGIIPPKQKNSPFDFEQIVKDILKSLNGVEVYTLSMVPQENVDSSHAVKMRNPLGKDTEYMRTSLRPSLIAAAQDNASWPNTFQLFEMANIYIAKKGQLPEEKMMLAGIFGKYTYREAKGVVEAFLNSLHIPFTFIPQSKSKPVSEEGTIIKAKDLVIGSFSTIAGTGLLYYEFDVLALRNTHTPFSQYKVVPKYPPQIEDITFVLPEKTTIGNVQTDISRTHKFIAKVELKDIYSDSYTFRIWYQDQQKTLTNTEVSQIREKIISKISTLHGGFVK